MTDLKGCCSNHETLKTQILFPSFVRDQKKRFFFFFFFCLIEQNFFFISNLSIHLSASPPFLFIAACAIRRLVFVFASLLVTAEVLKIN